MGKNTRKTRPPGCDCRVCQILLSYVAATTPMGEGSISEMDPWKVGTDSERAIAQMWEAWKENRLTM